jgi:F-box protein 3
MSVCDLILFFSFVRVSQPEGKPFEVTVAPFPLEIPEYIF